MSFAPRILWILSILALGAVAAAAAGERPQKGIPDYSLKPRAEVPVDFTWKIEDIYPAVEDWKKDKEALAGLIAEIDARAAGWTESSRKMFGLLDLVSAINQKAERLWEYASLQSDMEMSHSLYQTMKGEMQAVFADIGVKLAFINQDILKLEDKTLAGYFKEDPALGPFRFQVGDILRSRTHIPTTDQQKIISLTALFSGAPERAAALLNNVDIEPADVTLSDGTKVTLTQANFAKYRAARSPADRELVMNTFWTNRRRFENSLAALYDGGTQHHLFSARAGNFKDCLEARLFANDIDPAVYLQLIKSVKENLAPLHRFLKLRKELLGLDKYKFGDLYASAVKSVDKTYAFDEARELILAALKPLGPEYAAALGGAFNNRWIDIYPNKDKQSGAYSSGVYGVHPYIKMNYNGEYDDVSTLAHELGHALHSHFAYQAQAYPNAHYPTFLAEVASTFNENCLLDHMLKNETDDLFKLYLLDNYLEQARGTIYHQTMFAEFELAMHRRVEEGKALTPDWLNRTYIETVRDYYGHSRGIVDVDDYLANGWSNIPHFFLNFYVFQYSTGMIASMALADAALNGGRADVEKYLNLLKAGGNGYPLALLKAAGVDMATAAPARAAFSRFDKLVGEMETIAARLKAQGKL